MNSLIYLLQVSACTAVFYLFYYLFLNRLTFFATNRWYLLVTVILSFVIPLIRITVQQPHVYTGVVEQVVYVYAPKEQTTPMVINTIAAPEPVHWVSILRYVYIGAVLALTIHLLVTLVAFFKRLRGKRITRVGHVNILSGNEKINNGSFLNYIFLNEQELGPEEMQQIIAHEMLHVKLYHSADRILIKIAQIILWFNPIIYLYARSVEENHEFEVDRAMARENDKHNYANLLLHLSVAGHGMLYHNFSKVPLKKRITMLFNQPSANMKKIIYVLIVPVVLISCLAFARLKSNNDKQYSVIEGVNKLGKDPLVLIDGKTYPKDILYKISKRCIKATGIWEPDATIIKHGVAIKDGYVDIDTKNGKIIYLTPLEKENMMKERSIPQSQFYARIHLKNDDGTAYDKVILHIGKQGMVSTMLKPGEKAGFVIDQKLYNETEIQHITADVIASLSGAYGVGPATKENFPEVDVKGYDAIFDLHTLTNKNKPGDNGDKYGANTDHYNIHELFTRTTLKNKSGQIYDKVKVKDVAGSSAEADIPHNARVGFFLDHDLYSEDAFNALSDDIKKQLYTSPIMSATGAKAFSTLKALGYMADLKGYAAVFQFDYKHTYMKEYIMKRMQQDSINRYRQKIKRTPEEEANAKKQSEDFKAYQQTDDFKNKKALMDDINSAGLVTVTIKQKQAKGFVFTYNEHDHMMRSDYGQEKQLNNLLKAGDQVQLKVFSGGYGKQFDLVDIRPAFIIKDGKKIFQLAEADKIPTYPFLYEANKVRFADGQISMIQKYPNGKWRSAIFQTVNGFNFNISFKPNAPAINIGDGDHVRLRFVHEVKTGAKNYRINDWVSISTDVKDYGVKNPDLFSKYYVEVKQAAIQVPDQDNPLRVIASDSMHHDTTGKTTFYGDVHLKNNNSELTAGKVIVDEKTGEIVATRGNTNYRPTLKIKDVQATLISDQIIYNYKTGAYKTDK